MTVFIRKPLDQTGTFPFDPVGITDSVSYVRSKARTITDAVALTDSLSYVYVPGPIRMGVSTSSVSQGALNVTSISLTGNASQFSTQAEANSTALTTGNASTFTQTTRGS